MPSNSIPELWDLVSITPAKKRAVEGVQIKWRALSPFPRRHAVRFFAVFLTTHWIETGSSVGCQIFRSNFLTPYEMRKRPEPDAVIRSFSHRKIQLAVRRSTPVEPKSRMAIKFSAGVRFFAIFLTVRPIEKEGCQTPKNKK
jgi:hypothetical protein